MSQVGFTRNLASFLCLSFACSVAQAGLEIELGGGAGYMLDDNVYRSATLVVADEVTKLKGLASINLGNRLNRLNTTYKVSASMYQTEVSQNVETHALDAGYTHVSPDHYRLNIGGGVSTAHDENGTLATQYTFSTTPLIYRAAKAHAVLDIATGKSVLSTRINSGTRFYVDPVAAKRNGYVASVGSTYSRPFSGKTKWRALLSSTGNYFPDPFYSKLSAVNMVAGTGFIWKGTGKSEAVIMAGLNQGINLSGVAPGQRTSYLNLSWLWYRKSYNDFSVSMNRGIATALDVDITRAVNNGISFGTNYRFKKGFAVHFASEGTLSQRPTGDISEFYSYRLGASKKFGMLSAAFDLSEQFLVGSSVTSSYGARIVLFRLDMMLL